MNNLSQKAAGLSINNKENGDDGGKPSYVPPHLRGSGKPIFRKTGPPRDDRGSGGDFFKHTGRQSGDNGGFLVFRRETV